MKRFFKLIFIKFVFDDVCYVIKGECDYVVEVFVD